jgi:hypothetical protein
MLLYMHCTALDFHLWVQWGWANNRVRINAWFQEVYFWFISVNAPSLSPMTMYDQVGHFGHFGHFSTWQFFKPNSMKLSMLMYTLTESLLNWVQSSKPDKGGPRISYYKCQIYYVFLLSPHPPPLWPNAFCLFAVTDNAAGILHKSWYSDMLV